MARTFQSLNSFLKLNGGVSSSYAEVDKDDIIIPEWKTKARGSGVPLEGFREDLSPPLIVMTTSTPGVYVLINGYRRLKASTSDKMPCYILTFEDVDEGKRVAPILGLLLNTNAPYTNAEIEAILNDEIFTGCRVSDNIYDSVLGFDNGAISSTREVLALDDTAKESLLKLKDSFNNEKVNPNMLIGKLKAVKKKLAKQEAELEEDGTLGTKDMTNSLRKDKLKQDPDNRTRVDPSLKKAVLIRDKHTCQCCGLEGPQWSPSLVFHHKVPVALGGLDTMDNGVTLCVNCHLAVHTYQVGELFIPDDLTGEAKEIMDKVRYYGNIAIEAARSKDLDPAEVKKVTVSEARHPYPTENLKINREARLVDESLGDTDSLSDDELLEAVKGAE